MNVSSVVSRMNVCFVVNRINVCWQIRRWTSTTVGAGEKITLSTTRHKVSGPFVVHSLSIQSLRPWKQEEMGNGQNMVHALFEGLVPCSLFKRQTRKQIMKKKSDKLRGIYTSVYRKHHPYIRLRRITLPDPINTSWLGSRVPDQMYRRGRKAIELLSSSHSITLLYFMIFILLLSCVIL